MTAVAQPSMSPLPASAPATETLPPRGGGLARAARTALGLPILVGVWWLAVALLHTSSIVLPAPDSVASTLWDLAHQPTFWVDVRTSFKEFAFGYLLAVLTAVFVAAAFVAIPNLHRALWSEIELLRFVIPFSWIPLAVLWFGFSITGKIFIVWYAVFFTVILSAYGALAGVDPLLLKAGRMLGLPSWRLFFQVRLRAAIPSIVAGLRVGVGIGWISVIAAEYIGSETGLGNLVTNAQSTLETNVVIAGMVVIGVIGAAMSALARWVTSRFTAYEGDRR